MSDRLIVAIAYGVFAGILMLASYLLLRMSALRIDLPVKSVKPRTCCGMV